MATRPVIEIDVNDDAFRRFTDLFNDYSAKLDEQPEAWQKLNAAMGGGADALKEGAMGAKEALALAGAQAVLIVEELRNATKGQNEFSRATASSHKGMKGLAESAKGLGSTVFGIGKWLVGFGVTALGLGALASGFGFGALAGAALTRQRSANQLGLSPGQLSSFQINAQQFMGLGALQAAAETQIDVSKAGYLAALGIDFRTAQNETASALAFQELRAARAAWLSAKANNVSPMQTPAVMSYLALGGNVGDIRNAAMAPQSTLDAAERATRRDAAGLGFDRGTAAEWITLKKALDSAGVTIESGLIKALAPLAPQIATLSKEVVGFIATFLNSKDFGIVVDDVKTGLKAIGNFLVTTDWKAIGGDFTLVASEIGAVANRLRWLLPHDQKDEKKAVDDYFRAHPDEKKKKDEIEARARRTADALSPSKWIKSAQDWVNANDKGPFGLLGTGVSALGRALGRAGSGAWKSMASGSLAMNAVLGTSRNLGVDPVLALAAAMQESGGNPNSQGDFGWYDKKGNFHPGKGPGAHYTSFGLYQLHEGGELGNLTPKQAFDPATNAKRALAEFARVAKAHPDWTPGHIAAAAQRPADQAGYARSVNAYYAAIVKAARTARTAKPPVHVHVTNSTPARVSVSVNAAAAR